MAKIKIQCEIEFDEDFWYSHNDEEALEWFKSVLNDKKDSMIILHSNDIGDRIGQTNIESKRPTRKGKKSYY